ncbi:LamG-like jellyroll fold domain-containing protein [Chloroflexota bacterium]
MKTTTSLPTRLTSLIHPLILGGFVLVVAISLMLPRANAQASSISPPDSLADFLVKAPGLSEFGPSSVSKFGQPALLPVKPARSSSIAKMTPPVMPLFSGSGRVTDGLYVLYDFEEGAGSTVYDVSGVGSPLNLTIQDPANTTWISGGLRIDSGTIISSTVAATKIIANCQASNEISLEAWVQPANTTQEGPARILTLSKDTNNRNFLLGQQYDEYAARLRTTATDLNGKPELRSGSGTLDTELTHVVFTHDAAGTEKIYIDNSLIVTGTRTGDFSLWISSFKLALGNEYGGGRP